MAFPIGDGCSAPAWSLRGLHDGLSLRLTQLGVRAGGCLTPDAQNDNFR